MKINVHSVSIVFLILYFSLNFISLIVNIDISGNFILVDSFFLFFVFVSFVFFLLGAYSCSRLRYPVVFFQADTFSLSKLIFLIFISYAILVVLYFLFGSLRFNLLSGFIGLFVEIFVILVLKFPVLYCVIMLIMKRAPKFYLVLLYYLPLVFIIGSKMALFYPLVISLFYYGRFGFILLSCLVMLALGGVILSDTSMVSINVLEIIAAALNRFDAIRVFALFYQSDYHVPFSQMIYSLTPLCRSEVQCFNFHALISRDVVGINPLDAVYEPYYLAEIFNFFGIYGFFISFFVGFFSVFLFSFVRLKVYDNNIPVLLLLNLMGPAALLTSGILGSRNVVFILISNVFIILIMVILCRKRK